MEIKKYERSLQTLLSSAGRSRVLARLTSLAQVGELARRIILLAFHDHIGLFNSTPDNNGQKVLCSSGFNLHNYKWALSIQLKRPQ